MGIPVGGFDLGVRALPHRPFRTALSASKAAGQREEALAAFRKGLAIAESLARTATC
jgi:hypothetical protein